VSSPSVCVDDACRLSHCVACDAHPGQCSHTGARYLHPIVYEPVAGGYRVPEHERARWDTPAPVDRTPVDEETLSLETLLDLLDPHLPSPQLVARLTVAYQLDAARVSRLTSRLIEQADERGPCGLLFTRLSALELGHGET